MSFKQLKDFLSQAETCVVATVTAHGLPQAATVGFSLDDDFKILITTNGSTHKAQNLAINPAVAITVGFSGWQTVQLQGSAQQYSATELGDRLSLHFKKIPTAKNYAGQAGQLYFLITPTWARWTDFKQSPSVQEFNLEPGITNE